MAEWLGGWWLVPNLQHPYIGLTISNQLPTVKAESHLVVEILVAGSW